MKFTCATYNILHGYHRDLILNNIRFLMERSADVICLQEAEVGFEEPLKKLIALDGWEMRSVHAGFGGNVATLWNARKLQLASAEVLPLPDLKTPLSLRRLNGMSGKIKRVALIATFDLEGHALQITNVHLDWEGGARHRMRQLKHLRQMLDDSRADFRIITGDFNTVAPRPLRRYHERRVERALGEEFRNAFPRLPWTYDLSWVDPSDGMQFIATLARAGLKWRQRFDYMFAKDMTVLEGQMHDLPGSDHRPLIATFGLSAQKMMLQ